MGVDNIILLVDVCGRVLLLRCLTGPDVLEIRRRGAGGQQSGSGRQRRGRSGVGHLWRRPLGGERRAAHLRGQADQGHHGGGR